MLYSFSSSNAEIYIGNYAISTDKDTAVYMLRQTASMPHGKPWGDSFPPVVNHTSSGKARRHPDFMAAKNGDYDAAIRIVNALVKNEKIYDIVRRLPDAHVAYIHKLEGDRINMIPAAYAAKFASLGLSVADDIVAVTSVSHTNAPDVSRLCRRLRFDGNVIAGANYILLDDFITSGAELRDLRDYITNKGGNVALITTLGHGSYGTLKDIRISSENMVNLKRAGVTDNDLRKYGIANEIGCLTQGEVSKLLRMVNRRTNRDASQVLERLPGLCQEQSRVSEVANDVSELVEKSIEQPTSLQEEHSSFLRR